MILNVEYEKKVNDQKPNQPQETTIFPHLKCLLSVNLASVNSERVSYGGGYEVFPIIAEVLANCFCNTVDNAIISKPCTIWSQSSQTGSYIARPLQTGIQAVILVLADVFVT